MNWLVPGMAWFALLIPAVLVLWFLKMKRRDEEVSSTLLWSKVLEDKRVNSPFQRFRRSILLLLQLLVIALATLALMQPEMLGESVAGRAHILLVDVSASMAVEETGGTRLDLARQRARDRVDNMADGERAVVLAFDRGARAVTPVTEDRAVLRRALEGLETTESSTRIGPAIELAVSIAERQPDAVAVIHSDGNFEPWAGSQIPLPLEYEAVGARAENVGIVALSARTEISQGGALRIFVELRNTGPEPMAGSLTLSLDGRPIRVAEQPGLAAGERWPHTFEVSGEGGGGEILEVLWEPSGPDRLAADDRAWIVLRPPATVRAWLVGPPNFALDDAMSVLPHIEARPLSVDEAKEALAAAGTERPDVIIWDRTAPDTLPAGVAHLFLGALPPGVWDPEPEKAENPPIISWDQDHPLNRFIAYSSLDGEIPEAWILPDVPHSRALLDSRGGALIRTFRHEGSEGIVVSFDVLSTRWPLRHTFPLFLRSALAFLGRADESVEGIRPGDLITIEGGAGVTSYRVTDPEGRTRVVEATEDGWLRYPETDRLGPYRVAWDDPSAVDPSGAPLTIERVVPVSLLSMRESTLAPNETIEIAGGELSRDSANRELLRRIYWPWLLAAAILLLGAEWFFYHRR